MQKGEDGGLTWVGKREDIPPVAVAEDAEEVAEVAEDAEETAAVDEAAWEEDGMVEDEPVSDDAAEEEEEEVDSVMLNWLCTKEKRNQLAFVPGFHDNATLGIN